MNNTQMQRELDHLERELELADRAERKAYDAYQKALEHSIEVGRRWRQAKAMQQEYVTRQATVRHRG